jgi:hypothetical protein
VQSGAEADYSRDLIGGTSEPSPAPNLSLLPVSRSPWRKRCTATLIRSRRLQLSYFRLAVQILIIWHFQHADLELAQKYNNLLSLSAMLGIG